MPINTRFPYDAIRWYSDDTHSGLNNRGDAGNGQQGTLAPQAVRNQNAQPPETPRTGSGNPYAEILNFIQPQIGRVPGGGSPPRNPGGSPGGGNWFDSINRGYTPPRMPDGSPGLPPPNFLQMLSADQDGGLPGGNNEPPAGTTTPPPPPGPPAPMPHPNTPPVGPPNNPPGKQPTGPTGGPPPGPPPGNPPPGTAPPPPNISPQTWTTAQRWAADAKAQGQNYDWLLQNPSAIDNYYAWVRADTTGQRNSVDFVDWAMHQQQYAQFNHSLSGRNGYDTYLYSGIGPNGSPIPRGYEGPPGQNNAPPTLQGQAPPGISPGDWQFYTTFNVNADHSDADWQRYNDIQTRAQQAQQNPPPPNGQPPGGSGMGGNTPPAGIGPPPSGTHPVAPAPPPPGSVPPVPQGNDHGPAPPPPLNPPPPTLGGKDFNPQNPNPQADPQGLNAPPRETPTPTGAPEAVTPPPPSPGQQMADMLRQLLSGQFGYEQDQLNRVMNAQGALTGDINSGGFMEVKGRANSQLIANQGQRVSDYLEKSSESALDRALQYYGINTQAGTARYQIDTNKFIAEMQDETTRFGIQTNSDLQRWLDSEDNALKRYGIDKNDLLQRYQAELQLQGIQYSADQQLNGTALMAAAQKAAASANAQAQRYAAQIQQQIASQNAGLRQQEIENQYNFGNSQLAWQQWMFTHPSFQNILDAYLHFSPEDIAHMGLPPLDQIFGPH